MCLMNCMKAEKTDILQSVKGLKEPPCRIPDGYFGTLRREVMESISRQAQEERTGPLQKLTPYLAFAAMFAMIMTAGTFFLRLTSGDGDITFEDYLVMSDNLAVFADDAGWAECPYDNAMEAEDIADYLIYTGVGTENFYLIYE